MYEKAKTAGLITGIIIILCVLVISPIMFLIKQPKKAENSRIIVKVLSSEGAYFDSKFYTILDLDTNKEYLIYTFGHSTIILDQKMVQVQIQKAEK